MHGQTFSLIFGAMVVLTVLTKLWLAGRHVRHIAQHRSQVPQEFAGSIQLQAHQKAADYTVAKVKLGMTTLLVDTAVVLALTLLGGLDMLDKALRVHLSGMWQGLALIGSVGLITSLIELPFAYYKQFSLEAGFGFNRMSPALFFSDWIKGLLIGVAVGGPLLAGAMWLLDNSGPLGWLYAWLGWCVFNLLLTVLYPTVIAPLFNTFKPMEGGDMRNRIESLLHRCGFSSNGLYVMDGSKRSAHGNAYFTGFGRAKRIVFFDTLLERLSGAQIEAVLAHELGHFKRKHIVKHMALTFASSLALLWGLSTLMHTPWFYEGLGVQPHLLGSNTAMALTLFMLVLGYFTFPLRPVLSVLSRKHEYEADAYAAEHTDAKDLIDALVRLYQDNASTLTPDPVHSAFYDSHPPASLRIARLKALAA